MSKLVFSSVIVLASLLFISSAEASSLAWSRTYGSTGEAIASSLVATSDGGYAIAGYTNSSGKGDYDFWLVKTDKDGEMEWNQTYGGPESETVKDLITTSDGGFAILGQFTDSYGNCDCLLVKTDTMGNMEWNQTYGRRSDFVNSLIQTSDGGYAMAGSFTSNREDPFERDFWLIKTDSYGNIEWTQTYGEGKCYDSANALVETGEGGYLLVGSRSIYLVLSTSWIIKTDAQGNIEWDKEFEEKENSGANSVVKTADGGYAIAGYISHDFWLIKIDQTGNLEWKQAYQKSEDTEAYSLVNTADGGYALAGIITSYVGQQADIDSWIVKTDALGNMMWNQTYGGQGSQRLYSIVETSDQVFALAGYKISTYSGSAELWLIKTDEYGVVPEFSSWTSLLFVSVTALITIVGYRKKLKNQGGQKCHPK